MGCWRSVLPRAFALAVVALSPSCILSPEGASCDGASTCSDCIARSGCGWCQVGGASRCMPGSSLGADEGACLSVHWRYQSCTTPPPSRDRCSSHEACSTCRDDPGCGWCFDEGVCLEGTASGPSSGTCDDWSLAGSPGDCWEVECQTADTCGECLGRGCYWCSAGGYCEDATGDACDYDYQISPHDGVSCPATDDCYLGGGCESCTEIPGCVYCYDYNDVLDRYTSYGCHPAGHCPTLGRYDAEDPLSCP